MITTTTIRSWPAIGLAAFFATVTGYVLFTDVLHGAEINTSHVLSLAALVAAIASGHFVWPQLRSGALIAGSMLAVLFLSATTFVVVSSSARNADVAQAKASRAIENNTARTREVTALARSEGMLAAAQGNLAAACKGGDGKDCKGVKATIFVYEAAIHGHKARLRALGPEQAANLYAHAAKVLAAVPGVTVPEKAIEERLGLLLPFLTVLIAELGTIAFGHIGVASGRRPAMGLPNGRAERVSLATSKDTFQTSFPANDAAGWSFSGEQPDPAPPRGPRKSFRLPANVVNFPVRHPALTAIELAGGSVASNRELARLMSVSEGEASKRVDEVAHLLDIARDGKHKRIKLRA